jgi:hypothetical protein
MIAAGLRILRHTEASLILSAALCVTRSMRLLITSSSTAPLRGNSSFVFSPKLVCKRFGIRLQIHFFIVGRRPTRAEMLSCFASETQLSYYSWGLDNIVSAKQVCFWWSCSWYHMCAYHGQRGEEVMVDSRGSRNFNTSSPYMNGIGRRIYVAHLSVSRARRLLKKPRGCLCESARLCVWFVLRWVLSLVFGESLPLYSS